MSNTIKRGRKSTADKGSTKVDNWYSSWKGEGDTKSKRNDCALKGSFARAQGQKEHGGQVCEKEHGQFGRTD